MPNFSDRKLKQTELDANAMIAADFFATPMIDQMRTEGMTDDLKPLRANIVQFVTEMARQGNLLLAQVRAEDKTNLRDRLYPICIETLKTGVTPQVMDQLQTLSQQFLGYLHAQDEGREFKAEPLAREHKEVKRIAPVVRRAADAKQPRPPVIQFPREEKMVPATLDRAIAQEIQRAKEAPESTAEYVDLVQKTLQRDFQDKPGHRVRPDEVEQVKTDREFALQLQEEEIKGWQARFFKNATPVRPLVDPTAPELDEKQVRTVVPIR